MNLSIGPTEEVLRALIITFSQEYLIESNDCAFAISLKINVTENGLWGP